MREVVFETRYILCTSTAPRIDHLIIVAHHTHISERLMPIIRPIAQQTNQLILREIAILELIHMKILPAALILTEHSGLTTPELLSQHQQIIEINPIIAAEQLLIDLIDAGCNFLKRLRGL